MQQLTFVKAETLEWREVDAPRISADGQAIVTPIAVASCDLDQAIVRGLAPFQAPFAIGHEFIADVVEVGDDVSSLSPGDRVAVPFQISCGECGPCQRGLTANCRNGGMYGIGEAGGGFGGALSDRVLVPYAEAMLLALPKGVDPVTAASAPDNICDAWRTVGPQLRERDGASVLILAGPGANSVPLYAVQIAKAEGADEVEVLTTNPITAERAALLGASVTKVEEWPKSHRRYDIVVENANETTGLACALSSTRSGGVCTSTSMHFTGVAEIPILEMYMRGITLVTGRADSRQLLPSVIELIASGKIDPSLVTSEIVEWSDAPAALVDYSTKLVVHRPRPSG